MGLGYFLPLFWFRVVAIITWIESYCCRAVLFLLWLLSCRQRHNVMGRNNNILGRGQVRWSQLRVLTVVVWSLDFAFLDQLVSSLITQRVRGRVWNSDVPVSFFNTSQRTPNIHIQQQFKICIRRSYSTLIHRTASLLEYSYAWLVVTPYIVPGILLFVVVAIAISLVI